MPTVVDALVVTLELDPKKFDSGRRQAEEGFDKTKLAGVKTAKEVEGAMQKTGESVGMVKTQVLGLFAAFTGLGVATFAKQMITADASTGRAAKTLNMATKELGAWEGAAQLAGAQAGDLTSGFASMTQAFETAKLMGDASLGIKFKQLFDVDVVGPNGLKTAAELYSEIAEKAKNMDPARVATAANMLGIPASLVPLLLQGADALKKNVQAMRDLGQAGDEDAAVAIRLQNSWTRAFKGIQDAARNFYPVLTELGNTIAIAFSSKSLEVFEQRLKAVKAFGAAMIYQGTWKQYNEEQAKYEKMDKEYQAWQKGEGAKKFLGQTADSTLSQVGQGAANPPGGAFKDNSEKEAYIRAEAKRLGVDPDQAMRVAKSEGFYNFRSTVRTADGSQEKSFGAFQLYTGGGLGNVFQKKTGLDPSDPANEKAGISFALEHAARSGEGWRPWHGWKGGQFQGLPAPGSTAGGGAGGGSTTTVTIGKIDVNTQATDAKGIAADIGPAIRRDMMTQQSNSGPQ